MCSLALLLVTGLAVADSWTGLSGLRGVAVVIAPIEPEFEQRGMAVSTLQTDVELKLRQAGIRVVGSKENHTLPGAPYLYVSVNMLRGPEGIVAYGIQVDLKQLVRLERDPTQQTIAPTWSEGAVGTVGISKLSTVRGDVRDLVDKFINAYLAANQK